MTSSADDGARILSTVLRGVVVPHGVVLGPESPDALFEAVATAVKGGLTEFGWSLSYDGPATLRRRIDEVLAQLPPAPSGNPPAPSERHPHE